jgi:structure-specific recognition protein 1
MLWFFSVCASIKKKNPDFKMADVRKMSGIMWKNVHDKSEWNEKAAVAKEKYQAAMKEYEKIRDDMTAKEYDVLTED